MEFLMEIWGYRNKVNVHMYVQNQPQNAGDVQGLCLSTPHLISRPHSSPHTHTDMVTRTHTLKTVWLKYFLQYISSNLNKYPHKFTSGRGQKGAKDETKFRTCKRRYTHTCTHTHFMCVFLFVFFF